jgi:hypothetical protein
VEDVGEGMARLVGTPEPCPIYEFAGPSVITFESLLKSIRTHVGSSTALMPMPYSLWLAIGSAAELLPHPPVTRNQVELMQQDNVAWQGPGLHSLGIAATGIDGFLEKLRNEHNSVRRSQP